MFSVEIKINGQLINHIYGHNVSPRSFDYNRDNNEFPDDYDIEFYEVGENKLLTFPHKHKRKDGINVLIRDILNKIIKDENKKKNN